jgi:hypothetical protein
MIVAAILLAVSLPFPAPESSTGQSAYEKAFRDNYRSHAIQSCVSTAKGAAAAGFDITPVCTCAADRLLATKSVRELSAELSDEEAQSIMKGCFKTNPPRRLK